MSAKRVGASVLAVLLVALGKTAVASEPASSTPVIELPSDGQLPVEQGLRFRSVPVVPETTVAPVSRALVTTSAPVGGTSNLFGLYIVGRGSQFFTWTQPLNIEASLDPNFSGYRLYWWVPGSTVTNTVELPKTAQKALISGMAGANKPLTFFSMTVLNGDLESAPSNVLLVSPEP